MTLTMTNSERFTNGTVEVRFIIVGGDRVGIGR
jgi:hypothetical protein